MEHIVYAQIYLKDMAAYEAMDRVWRRVFASHPALLCAGETLSYGALEQRVSQFAVGLREAGVALAIASAC